jgi:lipid II:glycine glycyltransferase (peptidoglycan interpeptide bridge formation enzyme)
MDKQQIINDYFSIKHKYIYECANNILKKQGRTDLASELVSEACLYLLEDDRIQPKTPSEVEGILVNWMNKQIIWQKTAFKKKYIEGQTVPLKDSYKPNWLGELDFECLENNEEDMLEKEFEYQNKLNIIQVNLAEMDYDKKVLYDLVFNQGYDTSGKLAAFIKLSRTTCYFLIKDLKEKLKNGYIN